MKWDLAMGSRLVRVELQRELAIRFFDVSVGSSPIDLQDLEWVERLLIREGR
jgi:hypothetical protein